MSPSKLRVGAVRDKGTRPMHAFRTFLGDDDDFPICEVECRRIVLFHLFVCLWPGFFGDLWRVVPCFSHWSTAGVGPGVGLRVQFVVFATKSGTWFSVLVID